jgi:hypothetical protein
MDVPEPIMVNRREESGVGFESGTVSALNQGRALAFSFIALAAALVISM